MANACQTAAGDTTAYSGETGMGIGNLGAPTTMFKRKFRWLFAIAYCNNDKFVPAYYVKTASRPDLTIEETEINFLNAKTWIPGKASWETITVTYYDIASADNIGLWSWIATIYDFTDATCQHQASMLKDYAGTGDLVLLDGCGNSVEEWTLNNMWPTSIKFGDLDYSSSDICEIEVTLRYSEVSYTSNCGGTISPCACSQCTGSSGQ